MVISILTLFPELFFPVLNTSILKRSQNKGLVRFIIHNIRNVATDNHKSVDDRPFGGGAGMILRIDIVVKALEIALKDVPSIKPNKRKVILTEATGVRFDQRKARTYSKLDHIIIICGHYEGVDARINKFVDDRISIGPYVLTGGELPSLVITDAVTRLIPGVLEKPESTDYESFSRHYDTEPPQYTKPRIFRKLKVPSVLLSGNHEKINEWNLKNR